MRGFEPRGHLRDLPHARARARSAYRRGPLNPWNFVSIIPSTTRGRPGCGDVAPKCKSACRKSGRARDTRKKAARLEPQQLIARRGETFATGPASFPRKTAARDCNFVARARTFPFVAEKPRLPAILTLEGLFKRRVYPRGERPVDDESSTPPWSLRNPRCRSSRKAPWIFLPASSFFFLSWKGKAPSVRLVGIEGRLPRA